MEMMHFLQIIHSIRKLNIFCYNLSPLLMPFGAKKKKSNNLFLSSVNQRSKYSKIFPHKWHLPDVLFSSAGHIFQYSKNIFCTKAFLPQSFIPVKKDLYDDDSDHWVKDHQYLRYMFFVCLCFCRIFTEICLWVPFKLLIAIISGVLDLGCLRGHIFLQVVMVQSEFSSLCLGSDLTRTGWYFVWNS